MLNEQVLQANNKMEQEGFQTWPIPLLLYSWLDFN